MAAPLARVQVAEPAVAGVGVDHAVERAEPDPRLRPEVHLTVVGGDHERGVVGQRVEHRADEPSAAASSPGRTRPSRPYACATSSTPG